ncbi:BON domain-containing protein [Anabaena cylindrica FACHB-243]|uniref:Transport-associated protein n=1 Tax=Anabaena cylindrica (strain ATCC 27899 / PCC 7122) TaxID=272123 RepID=K9ZCE2_ANACC|nr:MULTISPECIES: BON domain-containing protein [Anabaena]AFZ56893.1 transport-associated protein [Anabaena cylindrica PCC 7122]MBD2418435.1 BON domain-containing protein [Anabaena cylindrica FACHB-243]MBY5284882.1 BON domain-containing protein [Anabaena sp. CCAP 1446/1C]MBY5307658.1 BON domain-containing protein [Anabaena sp. CCAP 1446/1C]MCM2409380.1 BON domain-containing protein [Anabaena sp. CCAP 1446/1C]
MKKLIPFLVSGILVAGVFGCQEAPKTGSETPGTTNEATTVPAKPASQTTQTTEKTAQPITAATTTPVSTTTKITPETTKSDLKTEVSKKLKEGLPNNKLEVENKEGEILLKGTAASQNELKKAETLTKEVKGVKSVKVEAKVAPLQKP